MSELNGNSCSICGGELRFLYSLKLMNKNDGKLYQCKNCAFTKFDNPVWLNESYSDAIAGSDLGLLERNIDIRLKLGLFLHFFAGDPQFKHLDFGGGYGIMVRLMRDLGFDTYWTDEYCENLFAKDFAFNKNGDHKKFKSVFAFEVVEHLIDPKGTIEKIIKDTDADFFIFTQELFQEESGPASDWWYLAKETGQHISFFHDKTLDVLASKLNRHHFSYKNFHIFSKTKICKLKLKLILGPLSYFIFLFVKKRRKSFLVDDVKNYFSKY